MRLGGPALLIVAAVGLAGCGQAENAANKAKAVGSVASVCTQALGLADLNPLVDPQRVKARAADKERRFRDLANNVSDKDVKASLLTMADSYVEVQRERWDDLTVVANWAKRNARDIAALRAACS
jgi:hypothetical protein